MTNGKEDKHIKLWTSAIYRIVADGFLDENRSDRLAGLRIRALKRADGSMESILTGLLKDQAELMGVLNSLYELHMPILSVEIQSESNGDQKVLRKRF